MADEPNKYDVGQTMGRRDFLHKAALTGAGIALAGPLMNAAAGVSQSREPALEGLPLTNTGPGAIPKKPLGNTGEHVSIIGIGGSTLGDAKTLEEAVQIVHEAVDAGVTFFDNAWEYNEGKSEDWMGQALMGRRDKVFLMTKVCTHGRDRNVAMQMLEESLRRLRTDHLDLWQIHECVYWNDPERHFAPNGVVDAVLEAKKQGKVRYIGFTGHKHPDIHLKMLQMADERGVHFDTVQMPLNGFDASYRSFEQNVLPEALKRGMGALGMKSLGGGGEPILQGAVNVTDALRYAMSLPVSTTISGIDSLQVLHQNLAIARDFKPMSAKEMVDYRTRCAPVAADGHLELYKSTKKYDADVGREQHGFPSLKELPI